MSQPVGRKEESRARILASAGRGFRRQGYCGLGVDGLAKEAGVTSGAFYAHFKSKTDAFREAVRAGVADLRAGVLAIRGQGGDWRRRFVDFYLGDRYRVDLADSCAVQSLTAEVARADIETRRVYEDELRGTIDALAEDADGAAPGETRARAMALLALLSGAVSIARAVEDPALAAEILAAARDAAASLD
jgi:AcrR family transcriptional regulator